jgi:hypothetical protein
LTVFVQVGDSLSSNYTVFTIIEESQPQTPLLATDYINTNPGFGIRYFISDNHTMSFSSYAWAVSQNFITGLPYSLDFGFTLNRENSGFFSNSLSGMLNMPFNGDNYLMLNSGAPSMNQGNFFMNLMVPSTFQSGMTWTLGTRTYTIANPENVTIGSNTFNNCQRINIVDTNANSYLNGNGYFLLAEGIGIVKLVFTRADSSQVVYTYDSHSQLTLHTLSGNVYSSSGVPAVGKHIQISNGNWGIRSTTDATGYFSLQCYGPDIVLRIGDDTDSNNYLDGMPKEYWVNNISADQTNLSIDLSSF